jgi:hypothetical protein
MVFKTRKFNFKDVRKLIHLLTGLAILLLSFTIERQLLLWLVVGGALFALITYNFAFFGLLHKSRSGSLGTLFYPAGVLSAYLMLYNLPMYFFKPHCWYSRFRIRLPTSPVKSAKET